MSDSYDLAKAFYDTVTEPSGRVLDDAEVGEVVYVETHYGDHSLRRIVRICSRSVSLSGEVTLTFRDLYQGERYEPPTLTILGKPR